MLSSVKLIIFLTCVPKFECSTRNDFFDSVIRKILKLNPHQICIFKSGESVPLRFDLFLAKISREIPTFAIDLSNSAVLQSKERTSSTRKALNSDLYVTMENLRDFETRRIENSLSVITQLNPLPPRSKYLIILIGDSTLHKFNFKSLFADAWALKFLDFSISILNSAEDSTILNYNPFDKSHTKTRALMSGHLFPDKLINMNGHKLKTLLHNRPPHLEFFNNSNEISVNGVNYGFLNIALETLNFKFDFVETRSDFADAYVFEKLERAEIDVTLMTHSLGTKAYKRRVVLGRPLREAEMALIGPIFFSTQESRIYPKIVAYSCVTTLIVLGTMVTVKLCKFDWTPFHVFGFLLGVAQASRPLKGLERLVYVSLALTSLKYSSDMFAVFSDEDVTTRTEVDYDAFEEIKRPSLPVYLQTSYFQGEANDGDEVIGALKSHSVPLERADECYLALARQRDRFCFNSAIYAGHMINKYRNADGSPVMKVARPVVLSDYFVHVFAKGSPYARKLERKFQQILESGLQDSIYHGKKYVERRGSVEKPLKFEPIRTVSSQLVIFAVGCAISISFFVLEIVLKARGGGGCVGREPRIASTV